jgi:hypothetical protein
MTNENNLRPEIPFAGLVYGEIIYWGTLLGSVIAVIGSALNFVTTNNYIEPSYMLAAVWEGKSVADIWENSAAAAVPHSHYYLAHLSAGDGLTTAGLALGVFVVIPGLLAAALVMFKNKEVLYGMLGLIGALITIFAMIP